MRLRTRIFRKLTVRPIREIEARYWYPIRKRAANLPPFPEPPAGKDGTLLILVTQRDYLDAIWSAWSHRWFSSGDFALIIACDGPPPDALRVLAARIFPGATVIDAREFLRDCKRVAPPTLASSHPLMTKLDLVLAFQTRGPVFYSDSDVLMLNEPYEIRSHLASNRTSPLYINGTAAHEDPSVSARAAALGQKFDPLLNSGLLFLPQGSLDVKLAAELLSEWRENPLKHFTEQTTLAVLVANARGVALPPDRYVANAQRMFYFEPDVDYDAIACRHFVNLIRNLMYARGLPRIWRQAGVARRLTQSDPA